MNAYRKHTTDTIVRHNKERNTVCRLHRKWGYFSFVVVITLENKRRLNYDLLACYLYFLSSLLKFWSWGPKSEKGKNRNDPGKILLLLLWLGWKSCYWRNERFCMEPGRVSWSRLENEASTYLEQAMSNALKLTAIYVSFRCLQHCNNNKNNLLPCCRSESVNKTVQSEYLRSWTSVKFKFKL
jgi:hypothetical protein